MGKTDKKYPLIKFLNLPGNVFDDNVDVVVTLSAGERRTVTFFTINNIERLMRGFGASGECSSGRYFWAKDMVIVRDLEEETIRQVVDEMVLNGEYERHFGISE